MPLVSSLAPVLVVVVVVVALLALFAPLACAGDAARREPAHKPTHDDTAYRPEAHHVSHQGAHHDFKDAEKWAKRFEADDRDQWQRPDTVIAHLGLTPVSKVADIGAATGYFPVRIAPRVPEGRVFGVDIEPEMVRYLEERAAREGHANLVAVLGLPDDPRLPEPVDVVLLVDTYHHLADRAAYFARLRQQLAPGGRVVVVDFKPGDLPVGPPERMRVAADVVVSEMAAAGYRLAARDDEGLPYQFVLVFVSSAQG